MALNISAWSIRNPLPSVVFSIILLVLGYVSFTKLAVTRLPSADIPVISVAVAQFGAAPAELESQVTKTIEDGVSGVEGVRHISSSITDGLSLTTIQFALETNTDRALNDVKDAVTRVRSNLPQNVTEPLIQRVDVIEHRLDNNEKLIDGLRTTTMRLDLQSTSFAENLRGIVHSSGAGK